MDMLQKILLEKEQVDGHCKLVAQYDCYTDVRWKFKSSNMYLRLKG